MDLHFFQQLNVLNDTGCGESSKVVDRLFKIFSFSIVDLLFCHNFYYDHVFK